ncbi:N-acetylmuramate alpha-1-phosphate uridylyltransferase MurU [Methylophaga lonarensis]|uniref:N-acetylmuramate alpha-1-phosphate uridylyltransferase MurU n=1 Tax=Methylophaga lonarensis TaxID=999151 RepID=UPI003D27C11B
MKAMILCAGRGERLRPLTDHTPKPLLQAGPERIVEYTINALAQAGLTQLVINTAHLSEQFPDLLGDGSRYGVQIDYLVEGEQGLETAGGIINALPLLGSAPFIVVNGDIWTDYPFQQLISHDLGDALCHLVMVNNPAHNPEGDFAINKQRQLIVADQDRLTFSGIGLYHPDLFQSLPTGKRALKPIFLDAIERACITAEHYSGQWSDIGTQERLAELTKLKT